MDKKFIVLARCADGDVTISENGVSVFNFEKAQEIKNAHANLGAEVEVFEVQKINTYTDFQGNSVTFDRVIKDVINLAEKNATKRTNANTAKELEKEVEEVITEVIIAWGLNPDDIKEDDINLLKYIYAQTQMNIFENELKNAEE